MNLSINNTRGNTEKNVTKIKQKNKSQISGDGNISANNVTQIQEQKNIAIAQQHIYYGETQAPQKETTLPSAMDIKEAIENLPPYQRSGVAKNYEGLRVYWRVEFINATPQADGTVRIAGKVRNEKNKYDSILVGGSIVDEDHVPIRLSKHGDIVYVEGVIEMVDTLFIHLKDMTVTVVNKTHE